MNQKKRVAVIGTGIGRMHVEAYRSLPEQFDVNVICDINAHRGLTLAQEFGIEHATTDFEAVLGMPEIEIVDICTPPFLHYEMAIQALAAGKDVVCEKPVAGSLQEIDTLIDAETRSGRRCMPVFQYRFGLGLQKLKFLHERGLTGPAYLTTVETAWRRKPEYYAVPWRGKWKTELGGVIVSHAIHAHDAATYILGPVKSVSAQMATLVNDIEVEDTAAATLQMADGSLCSLAVTVGSVREISRLRFCFRDLSVESNTRPYTFTGDDWSFDAGTPELSEQIQAALAGLRPEPEGMAGQFTRFYAALQTDGPLPVTLQDSRTATELITAMYASARSGMRVDLPVTKDHPLYGGWQL